MDLITTHLNTDFDGLGAMVAARKLYPNALCVFPGSQEKSLRQFFLNSSGYAAGFTKIKDVDFDKVTRLILVDVSYLERLGPLAELAQRPGLEIHIYDHHPENKDTIPATCKRIEKLGSATALLTEIIQEKQISLDSSEATIMLMGIFEDTGGLTFATTTPRDFYAAGFLLSQGADLSSIHEFITSELTALQVELLSELLKSREVHNINGIEINICTASTDEYVGDIAVLAHKICDIENLDVLFIVAQVEDRVQLVARSRIVEVDVSVVARNFGGGGHQQASSATIKDRTLVEAHDELLALLAKVVKSRVFARDIYTQKLKTVQKSATLGEVRSALNKYHINAMPVTEGDRILGIITRLVVERAISHELGDAPVENYMTAEFASVSPDTPLEKVRELIVEGRQRFLPVIEDGALTGAITRTDLLRALSPDNEGEPLVARQELRVRHVQNTLGELVSPDVLEKLKIIGRLADDMGVNAYLVGGMVRDLVMRRENLDIDVVVEGDGIDLARRVAQVFDAKVHPHKTFGTAKIKFKDEFSIDVATARTEYYAHPAAMPTVEQSSLKLDLIRRDFTVNTLAMKLNETEFGEIIDYFGGLKDIKERYLRVLHNLSFVEDPTRVVRAIRFSLRFDFKLGAQTARLMNNSITDGFFSRAKGKRLFGEFNSLFGETDIVDALSALNEHGALRAMHPKLGFEPKLISRMEALRDVLSWFKLLYSSRKIETHLLYWLVLTDVLNDNEFDNFFAQMAVGGRETNKLAQARREPHKILSGLHNVSVGASAVDSGIYRSCNGMLTESLLLAMVKTADDFKKKAISKYFMRLSDIRTILKGRDLARMGVEEGPIYRTMLDELLDLRLDGKVETRSEEIAWVEKRLLEVIDVAPSRG